MRLKCRLTARNKIDTERTSTPSWVEGSHINFYHDDEEAQELILEEDRLTYRRAQFDKNYFDEPQKSFRKTSFVSIYNLIIVSSTINFMI